MRKILFSFSFLILLTACTPRDFLTRRLAADLIAGSSTFRAAQELQVHTGIVSNNDYLLPESTAFQHQGWITAIHAVCPQEITPPPCWNLTLTPSGVETIQALIPPNDATKNSFDILAARRELIAVTGISKQGNTAEVEFTWHWNPLNEIGASVYHPDVHYRSMAAFRHFDDGWRISRGTPHPAQSFEDSLKSAEPAQ
ncbi:MAG: hypothetical protein WBZ11_11375 [Candidatus Sulfotelmatobacter sp.]|jgi:hypothetical protein